MLQAHLAGKIFTGTECLTNAALIILEGRVEAIVSQDAVPSNAAITRYGDDAIIAPAFIDAQVYGAAGKLFSVYPTPETLALMHQTFMATGTVLFQPTIATNTLDVMKKGIDAVRAYQEGGGRGVHGLHLEGPWLHPEKRGAHVAGWIHSPEEEEVNELLDYGKDIITMITLAPEQCSEAIIKRIADSGIIIAAGHSNCTYTQAMNGFENIPTVTHLFNAMSSLHHREPGLPGAVFDHPTVYASIIPDGFHVAYAIIRAAKKVMGDRLYAITDAVTETSEGPYQHYRKGDFYESGGILSGSALTMLKAMENLITQCGIIWEEAHRMCSLYPARVLQVTDQYGSIKKGVKAPLLVLDKNFQLKEMLT